jgi:hypothetical protein
MKGNIVAEPVTSTAAGAGVVASKIISAPVFAAAVASLVVMLLTMPQGKKHQAIALGLTFLTSIYGGAFAIDYFDLQALSDVAKGGIYLLAGLPAWVAVRGFFSYTERDKNKSLVDYIKEIRGAWKG